MALRLKFANRASGMLRCRSLACGQKKEIVSSALERGKAHYAVGAVEVDYPAKGDNRLVHSTTCNRPRLCFASAGR